MRVLASPSLGWLLVLAAVGALAGAGGTYVAYTAGPTIALALPLGAIVVVATVMRPVVGVCLALLSAPVSGAEIGLAVGPFSPVEALLALTAFATLARAMTGRSAPAAPLHLALAAGLVVTAAGVFVAEDTGRLLNTVVMWSAFAIAGLGVARFSVAEVRAVLLCLAVAGGLFGAVAVLTGGEQTLIGDGGNALGRATAGLGQPNLLGFFLVLAIPAGVALSVTLRGRLRLLALAVTALSFAGLALTLSRASILGAGASLVLMALLWPQLRRLVLGLALVLLLVGSFNLGSIAASDQAQVLSKRLGTVVDGSERSADPRTAIWDAVPEMVADHPILGIGLGNFSIVSPRYGPADVDGSAFDHAHNLVMTVLVEGGLLGLLTLVAVGLVILRDAIATLSRRLTPEWPLALAIVSAVVGILVTGVADYPFVTNLVTGVLTVQVACLVALRRNLEARRPT